MSQYQASSTHSRDSSAASSSSSPIMSAFPSRGHSRYSSSASSLATDPDSASVAPPSKTTLHDLLEDPAERDDLFFDDGPKLSTDEPLCICDTTFCQHRITGTSQPVAASVSPPEWIPGDDYFSDGDYSSEPIVKRRRSGESGTGSFTSRLSRHFPTIKKRFSAHRSTASASSINWRVGPPSRSSSLRLPSTRSVTLPPMPYMQNIATPPSSPSGAASLERSVSPPQAAAAQSQAASQPMDIQMPTVQEDPIDREELASTPLLPPMMMARYHVDSSDAVTSPLQSPSVAAVSTAASVANTPSGTPVLPGFPTPPLSAKPSMASLRNARSAHVSNPLADISPLTIAEEIDPWAIKLGHANFHIHPEPYLPEICDRQTCRRLKDNWEAANVEYLRQLARIAEHYGVTSQTYKLTQEKWSEIDEQWRQCHRLANTNALTTGDQPAFQPLPDTLPLAKMPSLNDPQQPSKFPAIDEQDIVGPMVRYSKIQHERRPSRKPAFLKIFTDPASLLSGRSSLNR